MLRLSKKAGVGGGTKCCKVHITRESWFRQKAMDVWRRLWSSAGNWLKGR